MVVLCYLISLNSPYNSSEEMCRPFNTIRLQTNEMSMLKAIQTYPICYYKSNQIKTVYRLNIYSMNDNVSLI